MKIRIGNTLRLTLTVKDAQGDPYDLAGKDLSLEMACINGTVEVRDYFVLDNTVSWTFQGKDQTALGPYRVTLYENRADAGQTVLDVCDAFTLVPCSCKADHADGIAVLDVDLTGEMAFGDQSVKFVPQTLTEAQKAQARENIGVTGGGDDRFVAVHRETPWEDIDEAFNGDKEVVCLYNALIYPLVGFSDNIWSFGALAENGGTLTFVCSLDDGWSEPYESEPLATADDIPQVVDNVTSTDTDSALSAKQGKLLNDRINNLQSIGRFLALWDCTTGLPETNPSGYPYEYHTGDYFRVSQVGATNYKPDGASYEGEPSTAVTTEDVQTGDIWFYDGTSWNLQVNHIGGTVQDVKVEGVSVVSGGTANIQKEVFVAEYGVTAYAAVKAAYDAGKTCVVFRDSREYKIGVISSSYIHFVNLDHLLRMTSVRVSSSDVWSNPNVSQPESVSNKVTTIDANSDNNHYPGAKAVYDFAKPKEFQLVATVTTQEGDSNIVQLLASCEGYTEFLVDRRCDTAISTGVYLRIGQKSVGFISLNSTRRAVFRVKIDGAVTICDESTYNYAYDGRLNPKEVYTQYDAITQSDALNLHYYQLTEAPAGETIYVYAK